MGVPSVEPRVSKFDGLISGNSLSFSSFYYLHSISPDAFIQMPYNLSFTTFPLLYFIFSSPCSLPVQPNLLSTLSLCQVSLLLCLVLSFFLFPHYIKYIIVSPSIYHTFFHSALYTFLHSHSILPPFLPPSLPLFIPGTTTTILSLHYLNMSFIHNIF